MRSRSALILTLAMIALGFGAHTATGQRGEAERMRIPDHTPEAAVLPPVPLPVSTIRVDLSIPLGPLQAAGQRSLPTPLAHHAVGGQACCPLVIGHSGTATAGQLAFGGSGSVVTWSLPVSLHASADLIGDCNASFVASIATTLAVSQDWTLTTDSVRQAIEWTSPCRVFFGNIDVTGGIAPGVEAGVDRAANAVDHAVGDVRFASALSQAWERVNEPRHLPNGMWLRVQPTALWLDALDVDSTTARIRLGAQATVSARSRRGEALAPALPANLRPANLPVPSSAFVAVRLGFEAVEAAVRMELMRAGITDRRTSVDVRALSAGSIAIGIALPSLYTGRAWFRAPLQYDSNTRTVRIGAPEPTSDGVREVFARRQRRGLLTSPFEIPLGDRLDTAVADLARSVVDSGSDANWVIEGAAVQGVMLDQEGFAATVACQASLQVNVH